MDLWSERWQHDPVLLVALKAGQHASSQQRGFSRARGPEQHQQLGTSLRAPRIKALNDSSDVIIAAIAGFIVKEIFTWLLKRSKSAGSKTIAWLKSHPRYIGVSIEAIVLAFMFWVIFVAGDDSKPATRGDVRITLSLLIILMFQGEQFVRHLREVRDLYHQRKA